MDLSSIMRCKTAFWSAFGIASVNTPQILACWLNFDLSGMSASKPRVLSQHSVGYRCARVPHTPASH